MPSAQGGMGVGAKGHNAGRAGLCGPLSPALQVKHPRPREAMCPAPTPQPVHGLWSRVVPLGGSQGVHTPSQGRCSQLGRASLSLKLFFQPGLLRLGSCRCLASRARPPAAPGPLSRGGAPLSGAPARKVSAATLRLGHCWPRRGAPGPILLCAPTSMPGCREGRAASAFTTSLL